MVEFSSYDDAQLMKEIKADNMFAFDVLYRRYSRRIYRFAYSLIKSEEETKNIVQDVFLNLWENRRQVEKNSSIRSYVFSITYNTAISVLRKKAKEIKYFDYLRTLQQPEQEPVSTEAEYNDLTEKLNDIINSLPKRQKEIYLMHRVEGLKYSEIAEKLHISVNTIENHMSRALKTIRGKVGSFSMAGVLFFFLFA